MKVPSKHSSSSADERKQQAKSTPYNSSSNNTNNTNGNNNGKAPRKEVPKKQPPNEQQAKELEEKLKRANDLLRKMGLKDNFNPNFIDGNAMHARLILVANAGLEMDIEMTMFKVLMDSDLGSGKTPINTVRAWFYPIASKAKYDERFQGYYLMTGLYRYTFVKMEKNKRLEAAMRDKYQEMAIDNVIHSTTRQTTLAKFLKDFDANNDEWKECKPWGAFNFEEYMKPQKKKRNAFVTTVAPTLQIPSNEAPVCNVDGIDLNKTYEDEELPL